MIIRVAKRKRFTVVDNHPIDDPELSFQALGLLVFLLSKPDRWEVNYRSLARAKHGRREHGAGYRGEGQHAVREALAELEARAYLVRRREKAEDGTWSWVSTIYEVPHHLEALAGVETVEALTPCGGNRRMDRAAETAAWETAAQLPSTDLAKTVEPDPPHEEGLDPRARDCPAARSAVAASVSEARAALARRRT